MIDPVTVQTLAAYNKWQNSSLYGAVSCLTDAQRLEDRGAFFKSIHRTFNHLLWADQMWMSRFSDLPRPQTPFPGVDHIAGWAEMVATRDELDDKINAWAAGLTPPDLGGDLVWVSGMLGTEVRRPRWIAIMHMFNHQTHHRGQVHAMLTGLGVSPQDTDLVLTDRYLALPA